MGVQGAPIREDAWLEVARSLSTSTIHEAMGQQGVLPAAIRPLHSSFRICGWATTVACPPGDNLWLHRAIYASPPGWVLVCSTGGHYEAGYWGEIMTEAARVRGLAGLVIDGMVRDGARLVELGFPIFCRGLCMRGTTKDGSMAGGVNCRVRIGEVTVNHGDLVVGDMDGVVVVPGEIVADVLARARERVEKERRIIERLRAGERTLDIFGLG